MTDLEHSLSRADFSHLKVVAEKWGLPFTARNAREALDELLKGILGEALQGRAMDELSEPEQQALVGLDARGGKEPWDHFRRRYGEIRDVGAGRLERERPDLDPISTSESLWYRALIARGFFETPTGPQEFVYIPEDVRRALIPLLSSAGDSIPPASFTCRKAAAREKVFTLPASEIILDQLCTLLAGMRMGVDPRIHLPGVTEPQLDFYQQLCKHMDLLEDQGIAYPENVRIYFELTGEEALLRLWQSWRRADSICDLEAVPEIQVEGSPVVDSSRIRELVIGRLLELEPGTWWSLESFISRIKEVNPDLLRIGGDYESWFIKQAASGEYLKGFQHWDRVEGALLRYLLTGPLHWLGFLDLGLPAEDQHPMSFRISPYAERLSQDLNPSLPTRKPEEVQIRSKGEIRITAHVPYKTRYQIARFCDWTPVKADAYLYVLSPASLRRAENQGLRVSHLLSLLKKPSSLIPPNILAALERWEKGGSQASISHKTILRLGSPAVLKALKKSRGGRYIIEQLGPTAVVVRDGSGEKIQEALVELGFFLEMEDQTGTQT